MTYTAEQRNADLTRRLKVYRKHYRGSKADLGEAVNYLFRVIEGTYPDFIEAHAEAREWLKELYGESYKVRRGLALLLPRVLKRIAEEEQEPEWPTELECDERQ